MSDSSLFHLLKAEGSGVSTYLDAQYLNTISSFSLVNSFYEMDGFLKWMDDNCDPLVAYCFVRAAGQSVSVLRWPQWAAIYTEHTRHPDSPIWATSRHGCQNWWLRSWHVQHQPRGRRAAEEDVTHGTPATRQTYPTGDHLGSHTLHTDATKQTQYEGALNEEDVNSKYFVYKIVKIPHRYII